MLDHETVYGQMCLTTKTYPDQDSFVECLERVKVMTDESSLLFCIERTLELLDL